MYKDFKKSESLDTGFVGGSGIIWMLSGIVLGLLVGLGMYYFSNQNKSNDVNGINPTQTTQEPEESAPAVTTASAAATTEATATKEEKANSSAEKSMSIIGNAEQPPSQEASKKHENKFSYYAVLPTLDVPVGSAKAVDTRALQQQDNPQAIKKAALRKDDNTEENKGKKGRGRFLLQVASFKRKSRADRARKTLSRRGIKARVQKKKIRGRLWYRIVAGPVDQSNANLWKKKAEKLGHHPIISPVR